MAVRRHLPVLSSTPAPAASTGEPSDSPPPWHWIPLGTTVSVVVFALFAPAAVGLGRRVLGHFYAHAATPAAMHALRAAHPRAAMAHELAASGIAVTALSLAIFLGGYVVGRYGADTNVRHGMLSGGCTAGLFWAITGFHPTVLLAVAVGMLVGHVGARAGIHVRDSG